MEATTATASPRAARGWVAFAVWPLVLTIVLVLMATWVAGELAARQERERTDTRLAAVLRSARVDFGDRLSASEARAEALAGSAPVQRALARGDRAAARDIVGSADDVALFANGENLAGEADWPVRRAVAVVNERGRPLGQVVAGVELDGALLADMQRNSGVERSDLLAFADGERVTLAGRPLGGGRVPRSPHGDAELGDQGYRFVSTPLARGTDFRVVALSPSDPIDAARTDTRRRALLAALATVFLLALALWSARRLLGPRGEVRSNAEIPARGRRVSDARDEPGGSRVRDAVALVGDALAATHDPEALLPVILQSAIDATGAVGARLVSGGTEVARAGDPEKGGAPLTLQLEASDDGAGRLLLYPPEGGAFDGESEELAHWLAAQASIALENERLHRTVKRQAITDELTQLANRRRFTETLGHEVRRAERFGDPLALVLADLDDFKLINDRFGHGTGDEVLRRFADVLRENVRDFDLAVRFGGEEFAVLLPETTLVGAEQLARRLSEALARLRIPATGSERPPVTASFGVASYPEARTAEELLTAADQALYRAKAEGKNRVASAGEFPRELDIRK